MENVVITFATTSDAMAMEFFCKKNNFPGKLIPIPNELSAGCGLAWRSQFNNEEDAKYFLDENELDWEIMKLLDFK